MARRERERRYAGFVGARVSADVEHRLNALADREGVVLGIIVRRVLDAGLPLIEAPDDGKAGTRAAMAEARTWWEDLPLDQRRAWQKRLPGLKGRKLIASAWAAASWEREQGP